MKKPDAKMILHPDFLQSRALDGYIFFRRIFGTLQASFLLPVLRSRALFRAGIG